MDVYDLIGAKTEEEKDLVHAILEQFYGKPLNGIKVMATCLMCANFIAFKMCGENMEKTQREFVAFLRGSADALERGALQ